MLQQARFPYVRFYTDIKESYDDAGHIVRDTEYYAEVTPAGGRDSQIKIMKDWLPTLQQNASSRIGFDSAGIEYYDKLYEMVKEGFEKFKRGEEMDYDGTPIRASLAFTKAEIANCEATNIFTLEDLANANEEAISRVMGLRVLKNKAIKILESQEGNKIAQENAALRESIAELQKQVKELVEASPKVGRPKKE